MVDRHRGLSLMPCERQSVVTAAALKKARAWPHALHFHAVDEKRPINRLSGCRDSPDAATVSRTMAPQSPARARGQEVTSQQESRSIRAVVVTAIAIFA